MGIIFFLKIVSPVCKQFLKQSVLIIYNDSVLSSEFITKISKYKDIIIIKIIYVNIVPMRIDTIHLYSIIACFLS